MPLLSKMPKLLTQWWQVLFLYSTHAYALFDSDAIHSFISTAFVAKHGLLCEPLETIVYVKTLVGDVLVTGYIFESCVVKIRGKELVVDLIVLDMRGFDVI